MDDDEVLKEAQEGMTKERMENDDGLDDFYPLSQIALKEQIAEQEHERPVTVEN